MRFDLECGDKSPLCEFGSVISPCEAKPQVNGIRFQKIAKSGDKSPHSENQNSPITSFPSRVASARHVPRSMFSLTDRADPSISSTLTIPSW